MRHSILLFMLVFIFSFRCNAQSYSNIDQYLSDVYRNHVMPGFSVVVVNRVGIIFKSSYGFTETRGTTAFMSETVNPIGSLTKSITSLAILQLVEQKKISLDVPVKYYISEFTTANPAKSDSITVRMLLNHTSGLNRHTRSSFDMSEKSVQAMVKNLSNTFILTKPGKVYQYSNTGFSIAGLLVSTVSGQSYPEYVKSNILQPLAMANSSMVPAKKMNRASGHYPAVGRAVVDRSEGMLSGEYIAAGQFAESTTNDLANYLMMYLSKGVFHSTRILSESLMEEMWRPQVDFVGMSISEGGSGDRYQYGLGWMISPIDGRKVYHHSGSTGTASSITMIDAENGLATSLLTNVDLTLLDRHQYPFGLNIVNNILHLAAGQPTTDFGRPRDEDPTRNNYDLPATNFDNYVGRYEYKTGGDNFVYFDRPYLLITEQKDGIKGVMYRNDQVINEFLFDFVTPSLAISRNIASPSMIHFQLNNKGRVNGIFAFGMELGKINHSSELWKEYRFGSLEISIPDHWKASVTKNGYTLSLQKNPDVKVELLRVDKITNADRIGDHSTLRFNSIQWEKESLLLEEGSEKLVTIFSTKNLGEISQVRFTSAAKAHTYLLQTEVLPFLRRIGMANQSGSFEAQRGRSNFSLLDNLSCYFSYLLALHIRPSVRVAKYFKHFHN